MGNKWKDIAKTLSVETGNPLRKPRAVCQRYNRVVNPEINKFKWSLNEIKVLKGIIQLNKNVAIS